MPKKVSARSDRRLRRRPIPPRTVATPSAGGEENEVANRLSPAPTRLGQRRANPAVARLANESYDYVVADLKRIGLMATVLFGTLIVLSFIIK